MRLDVDVRRAADVDLHPAEQAGLHCGTPVTFCIAMGVATSPCRAGGLHCGATDYDNARTVNDISTPPNRRDSIAVS